MKKAIYADKFFFEDRVDGPGYLMLKEGKFGEFSKEVPSSDYKIIDYTGKWVAPGLVDTHIHGLKGYDVMDNSITGLKTISEGLLACGVTSFLPTTLTSSVQLLDEVVEGIGKYYQEVKGAKIQGIFLEGPFFTETYKGAQNPTYFSDPSIEALQNWQKLSNGLIKKIAIAPECKGAIEFITHAAKNNVMVALGHSSATYDEAKVAVCAGASVFVHTFNGMSPLHHREPGMVGAAMSLKGIFNELICDGHHVHPQVAKILMDVTGRDRVALISDSMKACCMPDGDYTVGEFSVAVKNKAVRMEDGGLAGSVLRLSDGVKNVVDWGIATPFEAVNMASLTAAKSVGIDDVCGKIAPGYDADFIVLDSQLELMATFVDGEKKYDMEKEEG